MYWGFLIALSVLFSPFALMAQTGKASFSVIPLGVKGGLDESNLSAYLVGAAGSNDYVCLDAGSLYSGAEKAIQNGLFTGTASSVVRKNIKGYLLSHPHLDHVSGLIINAPDDTAKNIYALPFTLKTLQEKYFTWDSWANFANEGEKPQLKKYRYVALTEGRKVALQNTGMDVIAYPLCHSNPGQSTAFLIKNGESYLLYLGDTGPDEVEQCDRLAQLWQKVGPLVKSGQLKAMFIEVSFPNEHPDNSLFGHLTPRWLMKEMEVLNKQAGEGALHGFPVVITHCKSFGKEELKLRAQIKQENKLNLKLIFPEQGSLYQF